MESLSANTLGTNTFERNYQVHLQEKAKGARLTLTTLRSQRRGSKYVGTIILKT